MEYRGKWFEMYLAPSRDDKSAFNGGVFDIVAKRWDPKTDKFELRRFTGCQRAGTAAIVPSEEALYLNLLDGWYPLAWTWPQNFDPLAWDKEKQPKVAKAKDVQAEPLHPTKHVPKDTPKETTYCHRCFETVPVPVLLCNRVECPMVPREK